MKHPFVVIAQHWPCWLSSLISLTLPVEKIFAQMGYQSVFVESTHDKLKSCSFPLDHIPTSGSFKTCSVLGSGSIEFLSELPRHILFQSSTFVYACVFDFRRFRRERDLKRRLRSTVSSLMGMGLDAAIVRHADFGGVSNASYIVTSRGINPT